MTFEQLFGTPPVVRASAPGRVNLIGEHTDYNGGFVLPTVIPQRTTVELAPRKGGSVRALSLDVGKPVPFEYIVGTESRRGRWTDYLQGITWVLVQEGFAVGGADIRIESTVPLGSGLSSSAALEIALLRAFREAFMLPLDDVPMALLGQRAENDFVGAPVGVMDQMACTLASDGEALFLDTRSLEWNVVPLPPSAELVVFNSGIAHNHSKGDYRTRRAECEEAARQLGVAQLRDLDIPDISRAMALAGAARPPGAPRHHRGRARARRRPRAPDWRPRGARSAVLRIARLDAGRLRGLGAGDRPDRRTGPGDAGGPWRPTHRGRLRRFGGHAGEVGNGRGRGAERLGGLHGEDGQDGHGAGAIGQLAAFSCQPAAVSGPRTPQRSAEHKRNRFRCQLPAAVRCALYSPFAS